MEREPMQNIVIVIDDFFEAARNQEGGDGGFEGDNGDDVDRNDLNQVNEPI